MDVKRSVLWIIFTISLVCFLTTGNASMAVHPCFSQAPHLRKLPESALQIHEPLICRPFPKTARQINLARRQAKKSTLNGCLRYPDRYARRNTLQTEASSAWGTEKSSLSMTLFDERPAHTYLARTGLVGGPSGDAFPNHHDLFT